MGQANQHVRFEPRADGWGALRFKDSGKVLSLYGATHDNGAKLCQWNDLGQDNQLVRFEW